MEATEAVVKAQTKRPLVVGVAASLLVIDAAISLSVYFWSLRELGSVADAMRYGWFSVPPLLTLAIALALVTLLIKRHSWGRYALIALAALTLSDLLFIVGGVQSTQQYTQPMVLALVSVVFQWAATVLVFLPQSSSWYASSGHSAVI